MHVGRLILSNIGGQWPGLEKSTNDVALPGPVSEGTDWSGAPIRYTYLLAAISSA